MPLSSHDGDSGELRPGPSAPGRLGRPRAALVSIVPISVCGPVLGAAIWAISCCGVRCGSDGVVDAALVMTVPAATTATAATAPVGTAHRVLRVSQGGWNMAHLFAAGRGAGKVPAVRHFQPTAACGRAGPGTEPGPERVSGAPSLGGIGGRAVREIYPEAAGICTAGPAVFRHFPPGGGDGPGDLGRRRAYQ